MTLSIKRPSTVFFVIFIGLSVWHSGSNAASRLPALNVDINQSSISGVSSGAYMAVQFHVAFSSNLIGAGIVAGGPYFCTQGSVLTLQYRIIQCMSPFFWINQPDAGTSLKFAKQHAEEEKIDHLANMENDKIYIFSGTKDNTVSGNVVAQTKAFYVLVGVNSNNIHYVNNVKAGHAFLTDNYGNKCGISKAPFINDCDLDQAGAILEHIYGKLTPPTDPAKNGKIIAFSQRDFITSSTKASLSDTGYVYVPNTCIRGSTCKTHIALHGCLQSSDKIGDQYYSDTGYNKWAASNNIIVLYPQVKKSGLFYPNPNSCWDWWGYTGKDYYNRNGIQMAALMRMLKHLSGKRNANKYFLKETE